MMTAKRNYFICILYLLTVFLHRSSVECRNSLFVRPTKLFRDMELNIDSCLTLNNGVKMLIFGYGTWQTQGDELERGVEVALEAGYRHIDTAAYYQNEKVIGNVLQRWLEAEKVKREDLFIVSKLPPYGMRPERVTKFLKKSLEDLQLDYVDLYLVHVPFAFNYIEGNPVPFTPEGKIDLDPSTDLIAIWKVMEEQLKAGLVRSIGISNFNVSQIERLLANCTVKPQSLQIELHAYFQQKELVDLCKKNDIIVTAYSSLGSPGLKDVLPKEIKIPDLFDNPVVKALARKYRKTEAQILLRHIVQKGIVVIPKSTTPARIRENIDIFDFKLSPGDMQKMNKLDQGPNGRIVKFVDFFPGIKGHPEFPW